MYEILNILESMSGSNDKLAFLKSNDSPNVKRVFEMALNPYKNYGFVNIPEPIESDEMISLSEALNTLEDKFEGNQRSLEREKLLAETLGLLCDGDAEVLRRVIWKDLKCGVGKTMTNKAFPKLVPNFKCLLASTGKAKNLAKLKYPAMAQIKYDGGRVNFDINIHGDFKVYTRNGRTLNLFGVFDDVFPSNAAGYMIDGELIGWKDGEKLPRKISNGLVTKAVRGSITEEECKLLHFVAWDIVDGFNFREQIPHKVPCNERFHRVSSMLSGYSDKVSIAENVIVNSEEEAIEYFGKCLDAGEEGIIIKNMDGIWELKRSNNLVKMKASDPADLVVVDLIEGKNKYAGMLGAFVLETRDGLLRVNCGTGLSDEQRIEYFNPEFIGKIVEMTYNELIEKRTSEIFSMFLPVFGEIRYDKDTANSLNELIDS